MTTIVYRDRLMASDSRAYSGGNHLFGSKRKIRLLKDGRLAGVSSSVVGLPDRVLTWLDAGADPDDKPEFEDKHFEVLVAEPNGRVYYANASLNFTGPIEAPFFAIGSGKDVAIGALLMGASAEKAVEIACIGDVWSSPPITTLTF